MIIRVPFAAALVAALAAAPASAGTLDIEIERRTLDNGLRIVLAPDDSVPTVGVAVFYDVGSFVEQPGRTGFAHLFEHMMFQGTESVGKAEHFRIIAEAGGRANGTTGEDRTNYYQAVPSNALELALWLEADRMQHLALTPDNFENQRQTVMQERRERIDNQPYYRSFLRINELAYGDYFPYAHPVIGEMADLEAMPFEAAEEFFRTWYTPDHAIVVLAGDFDPDAAAAMVERHFGSIPRSGISPAVLPPMAGQEVERRDEIEDPLAPLPAFHVAWHVPSRPAPDWYALDLLATWLADGETSPLVREIVKEKTLAQQIGVSTDGRRGPDLFSIFAVVADGHTAQEVRDTVDRRLSAVVADGIPPEALERARTRNRARFLSGIGSNLRLALQLGTWELFYGDATLLRSELDRYEAVTADDVRRAAATFLVPSNRTILDVVPPSEPGPEAAAAADDAGEPVPHSGSTGD